MTKSAQIRELARSGLSRAEIAAQLGIRYQHVYNVLKQSGLLSGRKIAVKQEKIASKVAEPVTIEFLKPFGFEVAGFWELSETGSISFDGKLPAKPGVYAFLLNDTIVYVGVSARNLRNRINFYAKPGASMRTSIRVNELVRTALLRGDVVALAVVSPQDQSMNGMTIPMHTAVEAGLIRELRPIWNKQGL
jgi:hypothetical protein